MNVKAGLFLMLQEIWCINLVVRFFVLPLLILAYPEEGIIFSSLLEFGAAGLSV